MSNTSDIELTLLCAKAMGWEARVTKDLKGGEHVVRRAPMDHMQDVWTVFEPLTDDAQAMGMVKRFRMDIRHLFAVDSMAESTWEVVGTIAGWDKTKNKDLNRALVECVAKYAEMSPVSKGS